VEFAVFTILVVEDTRIVREPLARLLKAEGFEVLSAADGAEAIEFLATHGVDLILLDVLMPHMHGIALLEVIRADARLKDVAVIGLTGVTDTSRLARLRELGVKSIVHKVRFTFEGLLEEIRKHLPEVALTKI
jgi:CheY-like chemotaxis protein